MTRSADDVLDHVLYYVEGEPAAGPRIMSGWLIRKTCVAGSFRPATQADVDAWDPEWAPLAFAPNEAFVDRIKRRARIIEAP